MTEQVAGCEIFYAVVAERHDDSCPTRRGTLHVGASDVGLKGRASLGEVGSVFGFLESIFEVVGALGGLHAVALVVEPVLDFVNL